jgi:hypothetical protein
MQLLTNHSSGGSLFRRKRPRTSCDLPRGLCKSSGRGRDDSRDAFSPRKQIARVADPYLTRLAASVEVRDTQTSQVRLDRWGLAQVYVQEGIHTVVQTLSETRVDLYRDGSRQV